MDLKFGFEIMKGEVGKQDYIFAFAGPFSM